MNGGIYLQAEVVTHHAELLRVVEKMLVAIKNQTDVEIDTNYTLSIKAEDNFGENFEASISIIKEGAQDSRPITIFEEYPIP